MIAEPLSATALAQLHPMVGSDPIMGVALKRKGKPLAVMGLIWKFGGCFLWLDVLEDGDGCTALALAIVRTARSMLHQAKAMGEQVVFCQVGDELKDERLLSLAGFSDMGDTLTPEGGNSEVLWTWRPLPQ